MAAETIGGTTGISQPPNGASALMRCRVIIKYGIQHVDTSPSAVPASHSAQSTSTAAAGPSHPRPRISVPVPTVISAIAGAPQNWAMTGLSAWPRARSGYRTQCTAQAAVRATRAAAARTHTAVANSCRPPAWLTALRTVNPGGAVALSAVNSAEVAGAVLGDRADIGFVEGPGIPPGLQAEPIGRDARTLVVAPAHRWARRRSGVPAAELAQTALVSREAGSGTRRFLEEALRSRAGLEPVPPAAELSSTTAIKAAVAAGAGPAVLSSLAVAAELAAGTLCAVPVSGVDLGRTLMAVWAEGRRLAGPAQDLYTIAARGRQTAPRLSRPTRSRAPRPPEP